MPPKLSVGRPSRNSRTRRRSPAVIAIGAAVGLTQAPRPDGRTIHSHEHHADAGTIAVHSAAGPAVKPGCRQARTTGSRCASHHPRNARPCRRRRRRWPRPGAAGYWPAARRRRPPRRPRAVGSPGRPGPQLQHAPMSHRASMTSRISSPRTRFSRTDGAGARWSPCRPRAGGRRSSRRNQRGSARASPPRRTSSGQAKSTSPFSTRSTWVRPGRARLAAASIMAEPPSARLASASR